MVEHKLVDVDDEGRLVYEYWIENRRDGKGFATLDPETGEAKVTQTVEGGFGWHECHLLSDLRRKWQAGDKEPERGFSAWCWPTGDIPHPQSQGGAAMVSIEEFEEIYEMIPGEPEFEFLLGEDRPTYMIIKYAKHATFQRCATDPSASLPDVGEIDYPDLDALLSSDLIDGLNLRRDWGEVKDVVASGSWHLKYKDDIEDLSKRYRPE